MKCRINYRCPTGDTGERGTVDNALAKYRKQRGLTQKQLAAIANVAQSCISRVESNDRSAGNLSLDVAARLAAALGIRAEELLDE